MENNIKAVLLDVDGLMIVRKDNRLFSERLAEKQGVPLEVVSEFFIHKLKPCSLGKADLKVEIAPYLPKWKWEGTVDELLDYWFSSDATKDQEVLDIVKALRARGIKCYIATRQEKYRLQYLLDVVGLKNDFDGAFCTCRIGYDKSELGFFSHVLSELVVMPEEVLFFDDTPKNVDNARFLRYDAHLYDGIDLLRAKVAPILARSI